MWHGGVWGNSRWSLPRPLPLPPPLWTSKAACFVEDIPPSLNILIRSIVARIALQGVFLSSTSIRWWIHHIKLSILICCGEPNSLQDLRYRYSHGSVGSWPIFIQNTVTHQKGVILLAYEYFISFAAEVINHVYEPGLNVQLTHPKVEFFWAKREWTRGRVLFFIVYPLQFILYQQPCDDDSFRIVTQLGLPWCNFPNFHSYYQEGRH